MLSFNIFDIGDVAINTDVEADDGIAFFDSDIEPQKSIFSPASQPKLTERGFAMLYIHANRAPTWQYWQSGHRIRLRIRRSGFESRHGVFLVKA
jgi:hypothetical protein